MDPFDVYRLYLSLRLHFTTPDYDITKYKGAVKGKRETFLKRKDLIAMRKLARDYTKNEIIDFLVANFVSGNQWGGIFDTEATETYNFWLTKRQRLLYTLQTDLDTILLQQEIRRLESAVYDTGHPLVFKLLMSKEIQIETVVILEKLLPFVDRYKEDFVLQDYCLLIKKYKPFVKFDKDKVFNKHKSALKKVYGNVQN